MPAAACNNIIRGRTTNEDYKLVSKTLSHIRGGRPYRNLYGQCRAAGHQSCHQPRFRGNVNINSSQGGYNAVEILQWNDGTAVGFAYSHDGSLNGGGMTIPDYANGGPLTDGGSFYLTSNATDGEITAPGKSPR